MSHLYVDYQPSERQLISTNLKRRDSWFEISFDQKNEEEENNDVDNLQVLNKPLHAKLKVHKLIDHVSQPISPRNSISQSCSLSRSVSIPTINPIDPIYNSSSIRTSLASDIYHRHLRSNSSKYNDFCTHNQFDMDDENEFPNGNCSRHHHRRGSVAIRFDKPEFLIGVKEDILKFPNNSDDNGEIQKNN